MQNSLLSVATTVPANPATPSTNSPRTINPIRFHLIEESRGGSFTCASFGYEERSIELFDIVFENEASDHFVTYLIVAVVINVLIFIIIHKIQRVKSEAAIKYAKVVVAVALFGYVICIQGVKYFWGRVRFRELDVAFSQFTPWYLPQGITGSDSFPSGHAAMGWMLLALLILLTNKIQWVKCLAFVLIFFWALVLAFSRVVIGAHYASDVLFGSFFIITTFLIFNKINSELDKI